MFAASQEIVSQVKDAAKQKAMDFAKSLLTSALVPTSDDMPPMPPRDALGMVNSAASALVASKNSVGGASGRDAGVKAGGSGGGQGASKDGAKPSGQADKSDSGNADAAPTADQNAKKTEEIGSDGQQSPQTEPDPNSSLSEVLADIEAKEEAGEIFPGKQEYGNCGLQSVRQIIEQAKGRSLSESELEFMRTALSNGQANSGANNTFIGPPIPGEVGGTDANQRQSILEKYGVKSDVKPTTEANLTKALLNKQGVILNVDPGVLSHPDEPYSKGAYGEGAGHAIVVTSGKFDENGNLEGVYVNDTGGGDTGRYLTTQQIMNAANTKNGGSKLNVTKDPIS